MRIVQAFTREPQQPPSLRPDQPRQPRRHASTPRDSRRCSSRSSRWSSAIATALVVYFGGRLVFDETLTIGELVLFIALIDRFFEPIRDLSQQYNILQAAMAAGERIFEVLDVEPEVQDKPDAYRAAADRRPGRLQPRHLRLRANRDSARHRSARRAGRDGRVRRRDRRRQELDGQPADALRRCLVRQRHDRWPRRPRRDADLAALAARDRAAGHLPVRRHGAREHRVCPTGCADDGDRAGSDARSARTTSSAACRTATRPRSRSAASASRSDSGNCCRSPGPCWPIRGS